VRIDIEGDWKRVQRDMDAVAKKMAPRVGAQALNKTGNKLVGESAKAASKATGLPLKHMRHRYNASGAKKARRILIPKWKKATAKRLLVTAVAWHRDIPLIVLGAKQNKRGVRGAKRQYERAFIAQAPGGGQQAFQRKGKEARPIDVIKAKVADVIAQVTRKVFQRRGGPYFVREFEATMARRLKAKKAF